MTDMSTDTQGEDGRLGFADRAAGPSDPSRSTASRSADSIPDAEARLCDVCHKEPVVGVASSGLGPVSWGYCSACLGRYAEPAIMIAATIDGCDGLENVSAWVRERVTTFIGGEYLTFDEAAAKLATLDAQAMSPGTAETGTGSGAKPGQRGGEAMRPNSPGEVQ